MIKKAVLMVLVGVLIVFSASISFANQIDGMVSGTDTLGLPATIQASINPGALGDSLLYGYYNVRGAVDLFNVVNTSTDQGVKARVVFRNAKNSVECLDFSICLSEGDVWTGFLIDNGTTAMICSLDTDTITDPAIPADCQAFKYSGAGGISGVTADDCREGYFEIIGMTGIPGYDKADRASTSGINSASDCGAYPSTEDVLNVLMGNNAIIEISLKNTFSYNAIAVADTALVAVGNLASGDELSIPTAMSFGPGRDAIVACDEADYIFTKSDLVSPYDVITGFGNTDIVVTFPTRLACHNESAFADLFEGDKTSGTSGIQYCTTISFDFWDDKENLDQDPGDFSPSPQSRPCLPYEVNVIKLGNQAVWDSAVVLTQPAPFDLGWTKIDLVSEDGLVGIDTHVHSTTYGLNIAYGLPAVAYTTQSFSFAPGYMVPTAYQTNIQLAP